MARDQLRQPFPAAEAADMGLRVSYLGAILPYSNQRQHRFPARVQRSKIPFPQCSAHEFRDGGTLLPGASAQRSPQVFVQIELNSLHDIFTLRHLNDVLSVNFEYRKKIGDTEDLAHALA
jgi:hypothetical protein